MLITSVLVALPLHQYNVALRQYAPPECQWNDSVFKFHRVQQGAINVRNDQTYSVANSGANKFC